MKTAKFLLSLLLVGFAFSVVLTSCENNAKVETQQDLLPKSFSVDIPSTLSNSNFVPGGRIHARAKGDTLKGNDVYQNLGTFIAVGEASSKVVEDIINGIRKFHIDRVLSLTYISDDDNRTKSLIVESNVSFEGHDWNYELTISDVEAQGQTDGGKALQVFWNKSAPIKGIAIIKPFNCDRVKNTNAGDAIFRVDYSEAGELGYDAQMEVSVAGLPMENPLSNPYSISSLHMFAGKTGETVDVFGNSNHPNAIFFSGAVGFDWAFVASGSDPKNIGVAEVGLPPSSLDESSRTVLLKDYSIKNVFTNEINSVWPALDQSIIDAYLTNTAAPGYFSKTGFISGGVSPGADWDTYAARLDALTPYNPLHTANLTINFK